MQSCNLAGVIRKRCPVDEDLITPFSSGLFALHSEFALGCKPIALSHSTRHASPQAVNRTGTTPCCKLQSRFATRRRGVLVEWLRAVGLQPGAKLKSRAEQAAAERCR